jgi:hypothetical protein
MLIWLLRAYMLTTVVVAATDAAHGGIAIALCTIGTSSLFGVAGGSLSRIFGDARTETPGRSKDMMIGGIVSAVLTVALAQWLSSGFFVEVFQFRLPGWAWGWLGFIIAGIVYRSRKPLGRINASARV